MSDHKTSRPKGKWKDEEIWKKSVQGIVHKSWSAAFVILVNHKKLTHVALSL